MAEEHPKVFFEPQEIGESDWQRRLQISADISDSSEEECRAWAA